MRALSLPGCACRGAFQAAAVARLVSRGERWDVVAGASSGSITGATTVAGLAADAPDMWRAMAKTPVFSLAYLRSERSPFGMSRVLEEALRRFVPEERVTSAAAELLIATTHGRRFLRALVDRRLHESLVVHSSRERSDIHSLIQASCYIPGVYARVPRIDGAVHVDGGAADNTLLDVLVARGATDITVISPYPRGAVSRTLFSEEAVPRAPRHVRLHLVYPERRLRQKRFDFTEGPLEEALSMPQLEETIEAEVLPAREVPRELRRTSYPPPRADEPSPVHVQAVHVQAHPPFTTHAPHGAPARGSHR